MKKITSYLLIAVLCFLVIGCGKKEKEEERVIDPSKMITVDSIHEKQVLEINDVVIELGKTTYGELKQNFKFANQSKIDEAYIPYMEIVALEMGDLEIFKDEEFVFSIVSGMTSDINEDMDSYIVVAVDISILEDSKFNLVFNNIKLPNGEDVQDYEYLENSMFKDEEVSFFTFYSEGWNFECWNMKLPYSGTGELEKEDVINLEGYGIKFPEDDNRKVGYGEIKINGEILNLDGMILRDLLKRDYIFMEHTKRSNYNYKLEAGDTGYIGLMIYSKDGAFCDVGVYVKNNTSEEQHILDCAIYHFQISSWEYSRTTKDLGIEFANGFIPKEELKKDDIIELLGQPDYISDIGSNEELIYIEGEGYDGMYAPIDIPRLKIGILGENDKVHEYSIDY